MTTTPVTDPFSTSALEDAPPRPARLEIVDRHRGEKYGDDIAIIPNGVRVNGVPLWCPQEDPITVEEFTVNGDPALRNGVVVPLRLHARALAIGEAPRRVDPAAADWRNRFATVELPAIPEPMVAELPRAFPYAIVNGMKLQLAGPATVHRASVEDFGYLVVVTLPLVCRSVVFDDEPESSRPL